MNTCQIHKPLSGAALKLIACVSMLADHFCKALPIPEPFFTILSNVAGRIAFPLFCFLLSEGFFHTRNRGHYLRNMLILALLSEVPFDLAHYGTPFYPDHQNTCFTLLLGLLLFSCLHLLEQTHLSEQTACPSFKIRGFQAIILVLAAAAAWFLKTDYGILGICCLAAFYFFRYQPVQAALLGCLILNLDWFGEPAAFLALIPIYLYNGKRGLQLKYAFYSFYPLHLLLLAGLATL